MLSSKFQLSRILGNNTDSAVLLRSVPFKVLKRVTWCTWSGPLKYLDIASLHDEINLSSNLQTGLPDGPN